MMRRFTYKGFHCWYHEFYRTFGAILSRKGRRAIVLDNLRSEKELEEAINELSKT